MNAVEKIEENKIKLTFEVTPERFQEGLKYSYNKNKGHINIPGFRKGKAPRRVIERMYGAEFFYDDAVNFVLPKAYEDALTANTVEPVYKPSIQLLEVAEDKGAVFTAEVYVKPEVIIDDYYGLPYPKMETEPTEADIQAKLQAEREKNARTLSVDRPAENGDIVTINFIGYVDGQPFQGGEGKDYDLTLGSHTFIDTFEDQLLGCVPGDDCDVHVTFPEQYGNKELAGKPAMFQVEVLDVKCREYPEIDDEFAQDVSEFDTLAEYRQHLADKIREEKTRTADIEKETHVLQRLTEKAVMNVPEVMYTAQVEEMVEDFRYRLQQQGLALEVYLKFSHMTEDDLKQQYAAAARKAVNNTLVLEAVAKKEGLTIDDAKYDAHLADVAHETGQTLEQLAKIITPERKKEIMHDMLNREALDFVLAQAVATEGEIKE